MFMPDILTLTSSFVNMYVKLYGRITLCALYYLHSYRQEEPIETTLKLLQDRSRIKNVSKLLEINLFLTDTHDLQCNNEHVRCIYIMCCMMTKMCNDALAYFFPFVSSVEARLFLWKHYQKW